MHAQGGSTLKGTGNRPRYKPYQNSKKRFLLNNLKKKIWPFHNKYFLQKKSQHFPTNLYLQHFQAQTPHWTLHQVHRLTFPSTIKIPQLGKTLKYLEKYKFEKINLAKIPQIPLFPHLSMDLYTLIYIGFLEFFSLTNFRKNKGGPSKADQSKVKG